MLQDNTTLAEPVHRNQTYCPTYRQFTSQVQQSEYALEVPNMYQVIVSTVAMTSQCLYCTGCFVIAAYQATADNSLQACPMREHMSWLLSTWEAHVAACSFSACHVSAMMDDTVDTLK